MPSVLQIMAEVLAEVGDLGQNAVCHLLLPLNTTAGTFTITVNGSTTGAIAYNAMPSALQAALQALDTVGANNVVVSGQPKGPYNLEWIGDLAGQNVALPTASGAGLTPAASLHFELDREAIAPRYNVDVVTVWNGHVDKKTLAIRKLWTKYDLLEKEIARWSTVVNMTNGQEQREASDIWKAKTAMQQSVKRMIDFQVGQVNDAVNRSSRHGMPSAGRDARALFQSARRSFGRRC